MTGRFEVSGEELAAGVMRRSRNRWLTLFRSLLFRSMLGVYHLLAAKNLPHPLFSVSQEGREVLRFQRSPIKTAH